MEEEPVHRSTEDLLTDATSSTLQVCLICLDTDRTMFLMSKYKLEEAYEHLTGQALFDIGNLKHTLCIQCLQKLKNFHKFREESLGVRALMLDLVKQHQVITVQHIAALRPLKIGVVQKALRTDSDCGEEFFHAHGYPTPSTSRACEDSAAVCGDLLRASLTTNTINDDTDKNTECTEQHEPRDKCEKVEIEIDKKEICSTSNYNEIKHDQSLNTSNMYIEITFDHLTKTSPEHESEVATREPICSSDTEYPNFDYPSTSHDKPSTESIKQRRTTAKSDSVKHIKGTSYICDICNQQFKHKNLLRKHIKSHTKGKLWTCTLCGYQTKYKNTYHNHIRTHTGEKPFACKLCSYKCAQEYNLKAHARMHTGEKPFACHLCQYKCNQKNNLKKHVMTHTGDRPFSCNICQYKFIQESHLMAHIRTHMSEKVFTCKICQYICTTNKDFMLHKGIHAGKEPFKCKICEYKCTQNKVFELHMRSHTGERPYSCKICQYKFTQKNNLVRHMRTHSGDKPFECTLCQFKCRRNSDLLQHMRTHTGEKPYECEICQYKFSRNSDFVRHVRKHASKKT